MRPSTLFAAALGRDLDFLRHADDTLKESVALSRRFSFMSVDGGSGCSTIAAGVAMALAGRHGGPTLLVDAGRPGYGVAIRAGLAEASDNILDPHFGSGPPPSSMAEAMKGLPLTPGGIHCLELHRLLDLGYAPNVRQWMGIVNPIARFSNFVVSDFGVREAIEADTIASVNHLTCIVTRPERDHLVRAATLTSWLDETGSPTVLCVNDLTRRMNRYAVNRLTHGLKVIVIGYDKAYHHELAVNTTQLRPTSRSALLELSAHLITTSRNLQTRRTQEAIR